MLPSIAAKHDIWYIDVGASSEIKVGRQLSAFRLEVLADNFSMSENDVTAEEHDHSSLAEEIDFGARNRTRSRSPERRKERLSFGL